MRVYLNTFQHSVDAQRRLAIPRDWRETADGAAYFMLPGHNQSIHIMHEKHFQKSIMKKVAEVSFANPEESMALAQMGAYASSCICDRQGRIALPQGLMEYAGITDQAVLVGQFTMIRVMAPDNWQHGGDDAIGTALKHFQAIQEHGRLG
jgi:MraZ protein